MVDIKDRQLILGDCETELQTLIDDGVLVDLTVTSPPYDTLRSYSGELVWDFEKFKKIADLLYKITRDGGVVVWVVGDETKKGTESLSSFKQAIYFKEIGFNVHDTMIYKKANPIPQNHNRYEQCFEYMFVFSKGRPNTFHPIMVDTKHGGHKYDWGRENKMDDKQCRRVRGTDVITVKSQKIHENIFEYSIGGDKMGHPAVFPYQLAEDMVKSWSNEEDVVLDPFMGSGTTGLACVNNNRKFIGIEIYDKFFEMSKARLKNTNIAKLF